MFIRKVFFLLLLSVGLTGCVSSKVAVVDQTAVGNHNIHIVIQSDEVEDRKGVGPELEKAFNKKGVSAELGTGKQQIAQTGTGSGFLVAPNTWLTNYHVIKDLEHLTVSYKGQNNTATVVAVDKVNDLALLQANSDGLTPLTFSNAKIGEDIYVVGYPISQMLGDYARVTTGNVSSLYGLNGNPSNIQISAPIAPGNSGGPVVNKEFEVIGVVVSTANTVGMANRIGALPQGLNFAISPNIVEGFLLQNGIALESSKSSDLQALINSTALIWNGDSSKQQRTYIAKFAYQYYWDMGDHLSYMRLHLVDTATGETVLKSSVEANSMGISAPTKSLVDDILIKLELSDKSQKRDSETDDFE
ncbi:S1C family serine protease [Vibrio breoganii]